MLSESEIDLLIEKEIIAKDDSDLVEYYYYFIDRDLDEWFKECIRLNIEEIEVVITSLLENEVFHTEKWALPAIDTHSKILHKIFTDYCTFPESIIREGDSGLHSIFALCLDQLVSFDIETGKPTYERIIFETQIEELGKLSKLKIDETSIKFSIAKIKNKWLKEQIEIEERLIKSKQETTQPLEKTFDSTPKHEPPIDPLSLLNQNYFHLNKFYEIEKKALNGASTFNSNIRCAAFCENLYNENYITNTKTKIITLTAFAKARYGIEDISKSLAVSKKNARENHFTKSINKMSPLKYAFL